LIILVPDCDWISLDRTAMSEQEDSKPKLNLVISHMETRASFPSPAVILDARLVSEDEFGLCV
jgi:hypothetical protein